jgi:hypothetical protein
MRLFELDQSEVVGTKNVLLGCATTRHERHERPRRATTRHDGRHDAPRPLRALSVGLARGWTAAVTAPSLSGKTYGPGAIPPY